MDLPVPLHTGRLVRRYKRFLADIVLDDGGEVTAHCPNPGSMLGLAQPGARVWLSRSSKPGRKLPFSWELVEAEGTLVGLNTAYPNTLVAEALRAGLIPDLAGFAELKREVVTGPGSRIDIRLRWADRPDCFVEVKNVHLRRPDGPHPTAAEFPDCVTTRGARHMGELARLVADGHRAAVVFAVQRADCDHFRPAADIDPAYARALAAARQSGVAVHCLVAEVGGRAIRLVRPLPVRGLPTGPFRHSVSPPA